MRPGATLGPYRLLRLLGAGGCGEVWLAEREASAEVRVRVAVKVLAAPRGDPGESAGLADALASEARVIARLDHPGVARILDFHGGEDGCWMAMEYVRGPSLRVLLDVLASRGCLLPLRAVLDVALPACAALDHAHRALDPAGQPLGVVHRDVKPGNLLVGYEGQVKLVDFGIARASTNLRHTVTGTTRGTPGYLSPEQGEARGVGPASDLFSLACVVFEMAVGRALFDGPTMEARWMRMCRSTPAEDVAPLREIDAGLAAVVEAALARDPADRPASAHALGGALARVAEGRPPGAGIREVMAVMARAIPPHEPGDAALPLPAWPGDGPPPGDPRWKAILEAFPPASPGARPDRTRAAPLPPAPPVSEHRPPGREEARRRARRRRGTGAWLACAAVLGVSCPVTDCARRPEGVAPAVVVEEEPVPPVEVEEAAVPPVAAEEAPAAPPAEAVVRPVDRPPDRTVRVEFRLTEVVDTDAWLVGGGKAVVEKQVGTVRLPGGTGVIRARCGGSVPRCAEWSFHRERSDPVVELNCDTGKPCAAEW